MTDSPTEVQEVENAPEDTAEDAVEAPQADEKKSQGKRAKLPAGWGTPIQFAHALTERLRSETDADGNPKLADDADFRPQVVYSYLKNRSKVDPFPVHFITEDGTEHEEDTDQTRPALKVEDDGSFAEAMAWWDRKEERKVASAAKKEEKAKEKANKPAKADKPASNAPAATNEFEGDVVEAE